jgi:hypothetical protein
LSLIGRPTQETEAHLSSYLVADSLYHIPSNTLSFSSNTRHYCCHLPAEAKDIEGASAVSLNLDLSKTWPNHYIHDKSRQPVLMRPQSCVIDARGAFSTALVSCCRSQLAANGPTVRQRGYDLMQCTSARNTYSASVLIEFSCFKPLPQSLKF